MSMAKRARLKAKPVGQVRTNAKASWVSAADFKSRCLELMNVVRETREEYVVTKHGTPVAMLVPYDQPSQPKKFFGSMRGTVLRYDRPFDPIPGTWLTDPLLDNESK